MDDSELIQAYVEQQSDTAFRELVERHAGLVYASALRQVRDPHLAEDVAQSVFILLSRKARSFSRNTVVVGWLFNTTRFVAARAMRSEQRRQRREAEAMAMNQISSPDDTWQRVEPVIDEALAGMNRGDCEAILLRYIEGKSLRETSTVWGVKEEAAKKRVTRALERLREALRRRGLVLSAAGLAAAMTQQANASIPASLVNQWSVVALHPAASPAALSLSTAVWRAWFWRKVNWTGATIVAGLICLAPPLVHHRMAARAEREAARIAQQSAQARVETISAAPGPENPGTFAARARTLRLQVIAADDAGPVTNARVAFNYVLGDLWTNRFDLYTDGEGICVVPFPADSARLDVGVVNDGWAARYATWPSEGLPGIPSEYTLRLDRITNSIGGIIADPQGRPLAGAAIHFAGHDRGDSAQRERSRERFGFVAELPVTRTDANGRWRIGFIPARHRGFQLEAQHPDFADTSILSIFGEPYEGNPDRDEVKALWAGTLVTKMNPAFAIEGTVVDEHAAPIIGARIQRRIQTAVFETDSTGRFRVPRLPAGPWDFTVTAEGFAPVRTNAMAGAQHEPIIITLQTGGLLRIRVVDEFEAEVAGATVGMEQWGDNRHDFEWEASTDRDGRIEWTSAPRDAVLELYAQAKDYCYTRDIRVQADGEEHLIRLRHTLDVYGRVVEAETGRGIREMKAVPGYGGSERFSNSEDRWDLGETVRGTNGQFKITFNENVSPWLLRVSADGYEDWISPPLTNFQSVVLDIALKKSRFDDGFHGTVELPDGTPAAGATVGLLTFENNFTLRKKTLDGNKRWLRTAGGRGEFAFPVNRLAHTLAAVHDRGFIVTRVNDAHEPVTLRLQPWGRVEGDVDPVAATHGVEEVRLYDPAAQNYQGHVSLLNSGSTKPQANAHFVFEDVPPGEFSVWINSGLGIPFHHQTPIVVKPGETTLVTIREHAGALVKGRLVPAPRRRGTGDIFALHISPELPPPVYPRGPMSEEDRRRRELEFWSSPAGREHANSQQTFSAKIHDDGSFVSLERIPPGRYQVNAVFNGASASQKIEVEGDTNAVLDLGEVRLR